MEDLLLPSAGPKEWVPYATAFQTHVAEASKQSCS